MKPLLTILAHTGAASTIRDYLPQWQKLDVDLAFAYPFISVIADEIPNSATVLKIGVDAHKGESCMRRFLETLRYLYGMDRNVHIIAEYDTVNLTERLPEGNPRQINCGAVFQLRSAKTNDLLPQFCCMSPWMVTRPMMAALICCVEDALKISPPDWVLGLLDRWIGFAVFRLAAPVGGMPNVCAYPWLPDIHFAIRERSIDWVHGWKSKEDFKHLWPQ